jgi:L-ascorbate metabolism protein UlaG (beta-lactamase superfamily)
MDARVRNSPPVEPQLTMGRLAAIVKSGLKRYPPQLVASIRALVNPASMGRPTRDLDLGAFERSDLAAVWLGHASVLMRMGKTTILTDPVFSDRIGLNVGGVTMGIARVAPVPVDPARLPPIDLIMLSHAHLDHLDRPTLQRLVDPRTTVVTARRTTRLVPRGFAGVREVTWGERLSVCGVEVEAVRPAHWGARKAYDRHRGFNSYVITSGCRRAFYAGDTALTNAFDELGAMDMAVFGIGAYQPWNHHHANPEQVWRMFSAMQGGGGPPERRQHGVLVPIHHSTFKLSDEPMHEPMARMLAVAGANADKVVVRHVGESWSVCGRLTSGMHACRDAAGVRGFAPATG